MLLLLKASLHPWLSISIVTTLSAISASARVTTLTATHSVEASLTHTTFHLLKDVLTMLDELLEFVLELHHLLIHNL
jgi:ABC-type phosphate/phosphonate transport system ATPase subunit